MMMAINAYTMGKILEWFQRLIVLYSLGEDELPNEYKLLLIRHRLNNIHEADKCILYGNNMTTDDVMESYEFKIATENKLQFDPLSSSSTISVRFIIVNRPDALEVVSRNDIVTIVIDKDILAVTNINDSIKSIYMIVSEDLCYLLNLFYYNSSINIEVLCANIISFYFIKSVFKNIDWSIIIDTTEPVDIIAKEFVEKWYPDIGSYGTLISKIINEDDEVWSFFSNALRPVEDGIDKYNKQ